MAIVHMDLFGAAGETSSAREAVHASCCSTHRESKRARRQAAVVQPSRSQGPLLHRIRSVEALPPIVRTSATIPAQPALEPASTNREQDPTAPSAAETARTILDLSESGTLCTSQSDGTPLGTYTTFVLDQLGQPILRLRSDAVHTANLSREPRCSLFVQPSTHPARLLARATLIGIAEPADEVTASLAAAEHRQMAINSVGVDAPQETDLFYRFAVTTCFFVGGLGSTHKAEEVTNQAFQAATPDPLRHDASPLVHMFNRERLEDVLRIGSLASQQPFEALQAAELLWVDRLGLYVYVKPLGEDGVAIRMPFSRPVRDERDARSMLTLMAQQSWELERKYMPVMPGLLEPTLAG